MPIKKARVSASSLASSMLAAREQKASAHVDQETRKEQIYSGEIVDILLADLKKNGVNDQGQPLRFFPMFEEAVRVIGDLRISQVYTSGAAQHFKGQTYDSYVYTGRGYKLVSDVVLGDKFIDVEGEPTEVTGVYPLGDVQTYKVTFKDGTDTIVTDEHYWEWYNPSSCAPAQKTARMSWVNTTEELYLDAQESGGFRQVKSDGKLGRYKYAIPMLDGPALMDNGFDCEGLDPYLLGLLIGDGNYSCGVRLTGDKKDLEFYQTQTTWPNTFTENKNRTPCLVFTKMQPTLRKLGIFGQTRQDKRVPDLCLGMHYEKRLALLQGLMDSDGAKRPSGASFSSAVREIAESVAELVRGLGGYAKVSRYENTFYEYVDDAEKPVVWFWVSVFLPDKLNPFRLPRKKTKYKCDFSGKQIKAIANIELDEVRSCTCFRVAHIRHLYTLPGGIVTHNTAANSAVSCWYGQSGMVSAWSWPQASSLDTNMPTQHKPILEHWALKIRKARITRNSSTSNRLYDVGVGRNIFLSLGKGSVVQNADQAEVGAASASFTCDVIFAEEASQVRQSLVAPLVSRVEQSLSPVQPLRSLSTPANGSGIELTIKQNAEYEFYPSCDCSTCGKTVILNPLGTVLKHRMVVSDITGELEKKYFSPTGNILDWWKTDDGEPYIACNHCGSELDDAVRMNAKFRCIRTGIDIPTLLKDVVGPLWLKKKIKVALWASSPSRQKAGRLVARDIIDEGKNPSSVRDFVQQRLGIPSTELASNITQENIDSAFARYPLVRGKPVRLIGIDQGRQNWFISVIEFRHDEEEQNPQTVWANLRANVLFCDSVPASELPQIIETYKVEGGALDSKPSIVFAHQTRELTGLVMAEQFSTNSINDDLRKGIIKDAGLEFDVWKFKTAKIGRAVFDAFIAGRISLHPSLQKGNDLRPDSMTRHLRSVGWDDETAEITKATDKRDDLFFSMVFAFLAYNLYLVDPSEVLINSWNWWAES
jgi:hypothetical protein